MGLNLPDWLREALSWAGVTWPEADEELIHEIATSWRTFAANNEQVTEDALQAVETLLQTNESDGLTAFQTYWHKVAGEGGYMADARTMATVMSVLTDVAAAYVLALKIAAMVQLVALAVIIIEAVAAAFFTVGASLAAAAEAAVAVNRTINAAVRATVTAIQTQGRVAAEAIELLLREAIKHLEHRPIHQEGSPDRQDENEEPIDDRLDDAEVAPKTKKRGTSMPTEGGPPNGILKVVDPQTGKVTNYAEYDENGRIVKRVDVTGAPHNGVETPHVVYYDWNQAPNGNSYPKERGDEVRSAYPEEVPS